MTDGGEPPARADDPPPGAGAVPQRARAALNPLAIAGNLEYDRVLFFSDAVFAIAITLLVVDLRVPDFVRNARHELGADEHKILSFGISFVVIGLFWLGHHHLFRYITALDRRLILLNLLFLGTIAFLPYPTALLSATQGEQAASMVFYAACVAATGLMELVIWLYATRADGLVPASISPARRRYETTRLLPVPVVFALSIPVAFAAPVAAQFSWLLLVPIGRVLRHTKLARQVGAADN
ncbi:MAG: TMEM175 family protein [Streptosporangiaceae bacterium]